MTAIDNQRGPLRRHRRRADMAAGFALLLAAGLLPDSAAGQADTSGLSAGTLVYINTASTLGSGLASAIRSAGSAISGAADTGSTSESDASSLAEALGTGIQTALASVNATAEDFSSGTLNGQGQDGQRVSLGVDASSVISQGVDLVATINGASESLANLALADVAQNTSNPAVQERLLATTTSATADVARSVDMSDATNAAAVRSLTGAAFAANQVSAQAIATNMESVASAVEAAAASATGLTAAQATAVVQQAVQGTVEIIAQRTPLTQTLSAADLAAATNSSAAVASGVADTLNSVVTASTVDAMTSGTLNAVGSAATQNAVNNLAGTSDAINAADITGAAVVTAVQTVASSTSEALTSLAINNDQTDTTSLSNVAAVVTGSVLGAVGVSQEALQDIAASLADLPNDAVTTAIAGGVVAGAVDAANNADSGNQALLNTVTSASVSGTVRAGGDTAAAVGTATASGGDPGQVVLAATTAGGDASQAAAAVQPAAGATQTTQTTTGATQLPTTQQTRENPSTVSPTG